MQVLEKLMSPGLIWVVIPVIALIGYYVSKGLKDHYAHVERVEKIRSGIDPDAAE